MLLYSYNYKMILHSPYTV